jgi:hypothetical protein
LFFRWGFVWKTAGGAPCRLRSEAWLAGSPVHALCLALDMYMQQRWEVEPGLDTAWWSHMTGCAAVDGFSEEVEEKGPLHPVPRVRGRVWCRCVLWFRCGVACPCACVSALTIMVEVSQRPHSPLSPTLFLSHIPFLRLTPSPGSPLGGNSARFNVGPK